MLPINKLIGSNSLHPPLLPDQLGVILALDHALESNKAAYPYKTMLALTNQIHALPVPPTMPREDYFQRLHALFMQHGVNPWRGRSVALVGYTDANTRTSSLILDQVDVLLEGARVVDLSKEVTGTMLTSGNATTLSGGERFDYVITGNVLNAADNGPTNPMHAYTQHSPADTMHACALLLKQGGLAIHLLSYGPGNQLTDCLSDQTLHGRLGQHHLYNHPNNDSFERNPFLAAAIFQQEREIMPAPYPQAHDIERITRLQDPHKGLDRIKK